jgi:hypothetical protein
MAEVDSLPEAMQVPNKGGVSLDSIQVRFGQDVLLRQDLATIFLIRDNMGVRPLYFSWSDGGYPDQTLGLSPYLVSEGFVRKLMPTVVQPNDSISLSQGLGYLNLRRTSSFALGRVPLEDRDSRPPVRLGRSAPDDPAAYAVVYGGVARRMSRRVTQRRPRRIPSRERSTASWAVARCLSGVGRPFPIHGPQHRLAIPGERNEIDGCRGRSSETDLDVSNFV